MIQVKTFTNLDAVNIWLRQNDNKVKIIKMYSNGPNYFFVVYE